MANEAGTMFDPKRANQIIRAMWERDEDLPVLEVMKALRKERMGRSTKTVSDAIKRFMDELGRPGHEPEAFPVDPGAPEAVLPKSERPQKSPRRSKTDKQAVRTGALETEDAHLKGELARLTREATIAADRLAQIEERLRVLEVGNGCLWERVVTARRERLADFWDRVMSAVAEILKQHENLTRHDILEMIPAHLIQEARAIAERLDDDTLFKRMRMRDPGGSVGE